MKIRRLFCLILVFVLVCGRFFVTAQAENVQEEPVQEAEDLSVTNGSHSLDAAMPLLGDGRVIDNAKATVLFELDSETLLHAWNADVKMYPASLVKIMTAYVALEQGNLDDIATVREGAIRSLPSDSVSVGLQDGEMISLEDLLYCMMVHSANDAACVIAEHIAGSQAAFVQLMNDYASQLGCTGTHFTNPHGIHNDDQYTTARDVAKILAAAVKNEKFRTIFGTAFYSVPATNKSAQRNLASGNHMMHTESMAYYYDSRVTGGRTGVDYQGFRSIASTAEYNNMQLLAVVMGSVSYFEADGKTVKSFGGFLETTNLLDEGFDNYRKRQIVSADQVLRQISVLGGDCDLILGVKDSVSTILPSYVGLDDLSFRYTDSMGISSAPLSKGDRLSYLQVWYGPMCLVQADVFALNDVPVAYQKVQEVKSTEPGLSPWGIVLIVFAALAVLAAALLFGVRQYNIRKSAKKRFRRTRG